MIKIADKNCIKTYPFKSIPSHPNYGITEYGETVTFYSKKWNGYGNGSSPVIHSKPQYILQPQKDKDGYLMLYLKTSEGKQKTRRLMHLVLEAFGFERPSPKHEARHLDGNILNNHISNLKWGTSKENGEDATKHGRRSGVNNAYSKLNVDEIKDVLINIKLPVKHFMNKYKVGKRAICDIRNHRTYKREILELSKTIEIKLPKQEKAIRCIETGQIFVSISEAARVLRIDNIHAVLSGKYKTAGGYTFEYA